MKKFTVNDWLETVEIIKNNPADIGKLHEIINEIMEYRNIEKIIPKQTRYYRARIIKDTEEFQIKYNEALKTGFFGFDDKGSSAPPANSVDTEGRVNTKGESVLYLAEDMYTALAEVRPGKRHRVSIAEFEITEEIRVAKISFSENDDAKDIYFWLALSFFMVVNDDKSDYKITC